MKNPLRALATLLAALCVLQLAGCGGGDSGTNASIRLLNLSTGYDTLDLFTNDGDSDTDTTTFTGIALNSISNYAELKPDDYTVRIRKSGASGNLWSSSATLAEDTHITYVAYGRSNSFALLSIAEDVALPDSNYAKVSVLNTTPSGSLDVYLTSASEVLDNVSATMSSVATGSTSSTVTMSSGTYRLRITGSGDKTDLRLDVPEITLASTGVVSIILTDTPSGVLVNALVLPQQGALTRHANTSARIRGAIGLSTGSMATVTVGGENILSRRTARGAIADAYTTMTAESKLVRVYVDNVELTSATLALAAGSDYTLLVADNGGVPLMTLATDDNHTSTSGKARIRLINAMSALAAPLSLAVDYSPIAEYIDVGEASDYAEVTAGSNYQLDVSNANTTASLLTRSSVTLVGSGVYTFFLAGGGDAAVTGTLRKDR